VIFLSGLKVLLVLSFAGAFDWAAWHKAGMTISPPGPGEGAPGPRSNQVSGYGVAEAPAFFRSR